MTARLSIHGSGGSGGAGASVAAGWRCARRFWLIMPCVMAWAGCQGPQGQAGIHSPDPRERCLAIRAAAEAKDIRAVPLLVDRLEDEDEGVRFYAILALDRITGDRFGYDYAKPAWERAGAVDRWRAYVERRGHGGSIGGGGAGVGAGAAASGSSESNK